MMLSPLEEERQTEPGWRARLRIDLGLRAGLTRPTYVSHIGPLRIQRPFYPEDDGTCHLILLHPPGGVVGGDALNIKVDCGVSSRSLITTPAATKLYRCLSQPSELAQEVHVQQGAFCEWLPQETIAFEGANSRISTRIFLQGDAEFVGWEILCLGRPAVNEQFERGKLVQNLEIYRDERPLLLDRLSIGTGPCARLGSWGLQGQPVVGTMMFSGATVGLLQELRSAVPALESRSLFACTELEGCVVLRYVGPKVTDCWQTFNRAWVVGRRIMGRKAPVFPRIWKC